MAKKVPMMRPGKHLKISHTRRNMRMEPAFGILHKSMISMS